MAAKLTAVVVAAAWLAYACQPPPDLPRRMPPIAAAPGPAQEPMPTCVGHWPEARYRNYGYDHVVHLVSRCRRTRACRVSTDVSPTVIAVAVGPGEHVEVVTFSGSPTREFTPKVECSRATTQ